MAVADQPSDRARVRVERRGPGGAVAWVILQRPEVHNALDARTVAELSAIFGEFLGESPTALRGVVLAAEGASFCAGADIGWMRASLDLDELANLREADLLASMYASIDRCPVPLIARVQGSAFGGGVGLLAVADLVIAEASTRFGLTETRLGILPAVVAPVVVRRIGDGQARALLPVGRRFDAPTALRVGLVHEIATGLDGLDAAVDGAVRDLLAAAPGAARATKAIIRDIRHLSTDEARGEMARRSAAARISDEGQEGLRAFLDRRSPYWVEEIT